MLSEKVSLGFFAESGLDHARPSATDGFSPGESKGARLTAEIVFHRNQRRYAAARYELAAHHCSEPFRRHHNNVNPAWRNNSPVNNCEAMRKKERLSGA